MRRRFAIAVLALGLGASAMSADIDEWKELMHRGDLAGFRQALGGRAPELADGRGRTLLHLAMVEPIGDARPAMVRALLAVRANMTARSEGGYTPVHYAAFWCSACLRLLLDAGAPVQPRSDRGRTPLHGADAASVPLLLAAGADPAARDADGLVPLHLTQHEALLGPGVDARDGHGLTPLHHAALRADLDGVRWLLARGADPRLETTTPHAADEMSPEWKVKPEVLPAGQRPFDLARWRHEQSKWSTGQYRSVVEALDAVTPRRGWLRR